MLYTLKNYGKKFKEAGYEEYALDGMFAYVKNAGTSYKVIVTVLNQFEEKVVLKRNIERIKKQIDSQLYMFHKDLPKHYLFVLFSTSRKDMANAGIDNIMWIGNNGSIRCGVIDREFHEEVSLVRSMARYERLVKKDYDHGIPYNEGFPIVTLAVFLLCVIIFMKQIPIETYALSGADITHGKRLYSIFTYAFFHSGILHLIGNMGVLLYFGSDLEHKIGKLRYLAFTIAAVMMTGAGYVSYYRVTLNAPATVGYSGVLFAVLGALLIYNWKCGFSNTGVAAVIVINIISGYTTVNINTTMHYIGLASGIYLMVIFLMLNLLSRYRIRRKALYSKSRLGC